MTNNDTHTPESDVEQIDREAAASGYYAWVSGNPVIPRRMLAGEVDDHSMVQAFARHRLATQTPSREPGEDDERICRLRREVRRLREEAALDDRAASNTKNEDARGTFIAIAAAKRERADDIEALLAALTLPEQPRPVDDVEMREAAYHAEGINAAGGPPWHWYVVGNEGEVAYCQTENGEQHARMIAAALNDRVAALQPTKGDALFGELVEQNATMREVIERIRSALAYSPPRDMADLDSAIAADDAAGLSLRQIAKKHGVGVGIVRGSRRRAALGQKDRGGE